MKTLITTLNSKYIHKSLSLRLLYVATKEYHEVDFKEYTIKEDLDTIANDMIQKTVEINNCACSAIISNPLSDYLKLADTYQKLKEGFHIRMIRKQQWQYIFLDELQYDRIMLHISEDTEVHQFIRCKLGPLVEYDRAHDTQLLETLEALIQNHNSRKLAAESLFLHRNTMVHRINKIEEVLHCSLDDTEIMEQLEFAIKMKMYAH